MKPLLARLQRELALIKPANILIVEPDSSLASLLGEHLSSFTTTVVKNGQEALNYCHQTPPALVLIDTALPDMAVLDLCQKLLSRKYINRFPIILIGQHHDSREQRLKALEMGVDDYINKPFDIVELQYRIHNLLPDPAQSVDLVTGLPGWTATHFALQKQLHHSGWQVILIRIRHMAAYMELYGTIAGQQVSRDVANLLHDVVDRWGSSADFIGMIGECEFVILTHAATAENMLADFEQKFQAEYHEWYTMPELAAGSIRLPGGRQAPIMIPSTAVVSGEAKNFAHSLDIIAMAENRRKNELPSEKSKQEIPPLKAIFASS